MSKPWLTWLALAGPLHHQSNESNIDSLDRTSAPPAFGQTDSFCSFAHTKKESKMKDGVFCPPPFAVRPHRCVFREKWSHRAGQNLHGKDSKHNMQYAELLPAIGNIVTLTKN